MLNLALSAVVLMIFLTMGRALTVRLVGGLSPREGRIEVRYYNGTWGTVCNNGFTDTSAGVVCYMLGYGRYGRFIGYRYYRGTGTIWLDNVQCNGTETSVAYCQHSGWGRHNCRRSYVVSVFCITVRERESLLTK